MVLSCYKAVQILCCATTPQSLCHTPRKSTWRFIVSIFVRNSRKDHKKVQSQQYCFTHGKTTRSSEVVIIVLTPAKTTRCCRISNIVHTPGKATRSSCPYSREDTRNNQLFGFNSRITSVLTQVLMYLFPLLSFSFMGWVLLVRVMKLIK